MPGRIGIIVAALMASTCLAAAPLAAYADQPVEGNGPFTNALSPVFERIADGNTFIDYTFTEITVGIWDGTRVGSGELVIHPDGSLNTTNSGIFTGTIAGRSGTAEIRASGSGTFAAAEATAIVDHGTGGLAGVHAVANASGSAVGPTTLAGTYSLKVNFGAPAG